ncbi:MAG TPA: Lrp/AsnC family transcriptional regulator [Thermoplasmata archaeon]|nr:Lrp/AsnC family transcriptional regulator [Thermoplasmata archaeon]
MDPLDVRIIRAMGIQTYGREPKPADGLRISRLARTLRVTKERLKDRIQKMEKTGIIAGYGLYPNLRHLGLESSWYYYRFREDEEVDRAFAKLQPLDGVSACCSFFGGVMCVGVYYRNPLDLQKKLRIMVGLVGDAGGELNKLYDLDMPPVHRPLTHLDWSVVKALHEDAVRPLPEVAKEIGVSEKTVKRRFDRMGREGSFFIIPEVDPSQAEGVVVFVLAVQFGADAEPGIVGTVERVYEGHLVSTDLTTSRDFGTCAMLLYANSMAEVERLRKKGASLPGVAKVRSFLIRDAGGDWRWMDEAIQERLAATAKMKEPD